MARASLGSADSELVGRDVEAARVDAIFERLSSGGTGLVVSGEAGVGKSALLLYARARADAIGVRTLTAVGVESEAELPFAGLHQLLYPILGLLELLPRPQRRALELAFGLASGPEPDPFLVALAAYQLVCDAAEESPLLILADDAHCLDRSTSGVLTFIARRLENERVALLVSVRARVATPLGDAGLPTLELERLSPSAAAALLDRRSPDLHPVLRARVLAEAAGNPLALVELVRAQGTADGPDGQFIDAPLPLTARLERAFAAQLDGLPGDTRWFCWRRRSMVARRWRNSSYRRRWLPVGRLDYRSWSRLSPRSSSRSSTGSCASVTRSFARRCVRRHARLRFWRPMERWRRS